MSRNVYGMCRTPEYVAWCNMKTRCYNKNSTNYYRWGGRGIEVHSEWINNFSIFYEYMGDRPSNKHSLDRIDNDRGYEPGNVRWATKEEQMLNRGEFNISANNISGYKGVTYHRNKWRARVTKNYVVTELGHFYTPKEAYDAIVSFKRR